MSELRRPQLAAAPRRHLAAVLFCLLAVACAATHSLEPDSETADDADARSFDGGFDATMPATDTGIDSAIDPECPDRVAAFDAVLAALCARQRACGATAEHQQYGLIPTGEGPVVQWCDTTQWPAQRERLAACEAHVDVEAAATCIDGLAGFSTCRVSSHDPMGGLFGTDESAPFDAVRLSCERAYVDDRMPCGSVPGTGRFRGECCDTRCGGWLACVAGRCGGDGCADSACRATGHVARCVDGRCDERREIGESCGDLAVCRFDAYCRWDGAQTCVARAASIGLGEACASDTECGVEARCDLGRCASASYCYGQADLCEPGRFCAPSPTGGNRCGEALGALCDYSWLGTVWVDTCPDGLTCSGHAGERFCRPTVAEGGSCDVAHVCGSGLGCSVGRCVVLGYEMDPCDDDGACGAPLVCVGGVCGWRAP